MVYFFFRFSFFHLYIKYKKKKLKKLILTLSVMCVTHVSVYSQVRIEDYPGYPQGAEYLERG